MFQKIRGFFKAYHELGFVIVAIIVGLTLDVSGQHTAAHWVLGVSALVATIPLVWGMFQSVREGEYGLDILAATAIVTSVLLHEYWAGMVIVLMLTGGEALEDYAEARAKVELTALMERAPKKAHLLRGRNKTVDVPVKSVRTNDKLIIKPGEVVPVDAVILEGSASFDESSLTGESLPVEKKAGEQILSGSINLDGNITVKALHTAEDSQYEQIIKLVRAATSSQAPFVRLADRYSIPFTIIAFALAGGTWALTGQAIRFLEVLVVATPCPLLLGAPIALVSGMSRAAKNGIIVKTGSALERLGEIKTMAFDKTGTLTKGEPVVGQITTYGKFTKKDIVRLAAALEQGSNHILARAIVDAADKQSIKLPKVKNIREEAGLGLRGAVDHHEVLVGKLSFMKEAGISLPKSLGKDSPKQTAAWVAVDGQLAGVITFIDELRPETKETLERLRKAGVRNFLMVTGDNKATAMTIARQLGIDDVYAEVLPADKLHVIENITKRPVAFVGDGVNDAPVLVAADVGIAIGTRGSTVASESADVVILQDDLSRVASAVEIARRTFFIAKQSILIGIFISIGLMIIFATGRFKPIYGAAIQELVDITVIFNALRAHGSFNKAKKLPNLAHQVQAI